MKEAIETFVKRVRDLAEHVRGNEQATKQSLIGPLFSLLGYDLTDPRECLPEYKVDFGKERSTKPIDWAFFSNGKPLFFVEAKEASRRLVGFDEQLADYFAKSPEAKLGILTNGVQWRFFTDVSHLNVMDKEPFLKWDVLSDEKPPLDFLTILQKSQFNPQLIRAFAEQRRNQNLLLNELSRLLEPSSEFVRLAVSNIETRKMTENVIDGWKPVLASALQEWVRQRMLSMALEPAATLEPQADSPRIETTQEELEGFATIQSHLGPDRPIAHEDTLSYFKVHLKERYTWVMCRLYFGRKRPIIWVPLSIEEAQPLADGFSMSTPQVGWTCVSLNSPADLKDLGELLRRSYDSQRSTRLKAPEESERDERNSTDG
ncbi:MAG: type I restriction endonuclease [Isosphaeraceae bacterium]|nr:type I restriction endonuclease [Isosphaeraceae bacterium]